MPKWFAQSVCPSVRSAWPVPPVTGAGAGGAVLCCTPCCHLHLCQRGGCQGKPGEISFPLLLSCPSSRVESSRPVPGSCCCPWTGLGEWFNKGISVHSVRRFCSRQRSPHQQRAVVVLCLKMLEPNCVNLSEPDAVLSSAGPWQTSSRMTKGDVSCSKHKPEMQSFPSLPLPSYSL